MPSFVARLIVFLLHRIVAGWPFWERDKSTKSSREIAKLAVDFSQNVTWFSLCVTRSVLIRISKTRYRWKDQSAVAAYQFTSLNWKLNAWVQEGKYASFVTKTTEAAAKGFIILITHFCAIFFPLFLKLLGKKTASITLFLFQPFLTAPIPLPLPPTAEAEFVDIVWNSINKEPLNFPAAALCVTVCFVGCFFFFPTNTFVLSWYASLLFQ